LVSTIEDDAQSVKKVKSILNTTSMIYLIYHLFDHICSNCQIQLLNKQNSTLNNHIDVIEIVRDGLLRQLRMKRDKYSLKNSNQYLIIIQNTIF
jgi:hypothetical protein